MMLRRLLNILTSLRLTVICLAMALVLVFCGTVAQVNEGLYDAQNRWFRSAFVWFGPKSGEWQVPLLPGGYLVGIVLVLNLLAAHIRRFELAWRKLGIHLTHGGLILLLIGQLATDLFSRETQMSFAEGEARNFSVSPMANELVFATDSPTPGEEDVVAIPDLRLREPTEIRHERLPFTIRVREYHLNADVRQRAPMIDTNPPPATAGFGPTVTLVPEPETKRMDQRNLPAVIVELVGAQGSLGTWVGHSRLRDQEVQVGDRVWRLGFRFERTYHPFSIQLLKTTHEVYRGTISAANPQGIPKNFQSRVRVNNPALAESREVDIYMNNPLRYGGLTFYQHQMGREELQGGRGTSVLQVVRNPSWLTPYVGCALVGGGLAVQFLMHLAGFLKKRRMA